MKALQRTALVLIAIAVVVAILPYFSDGAGAIGLALLTMFIIAPALILIALICVIIAAFIRIQREPGSLYSQQLTVRRWVIGYTIALIAVSWWCSASGTLGIVWIIPLPLLALLYLPLLLLTIRLHRSVRTDQRAQARPADPAALADPTAPTGQTAAGAAQNDDDSHLSIDDPDDPRFVDPRFIDRATGRNADRDADRDRRQRSVLVVTSYLLAPITVVALMLSIAWSTMRETS